MKLLLALDGGSDAGDVLDRTVERAAAAGDALTVAVFEGAYGEGDGLASAAAERLAAAGVDGDVVRLEGDPGSSIVELAESEGYDRIVLDGGTQSPMGKIEVGTVAEYVLLNSHVTVTLVR